eukprot:tig00021293_g20023.t2
MEVNLSLRAETRWGESVHVSGSTTSFGRWQKRIPLITTPETYPLWTGTITVASGESVDYKYIICTGPNGENVARWEGFPGNRLYVFPRGRSRLFIDDGDFGAYNPQIRLKNLETMLAEAEMDARVPSESDGLGQPAVCDKPDDAGVPACPRMAAAPSSPSPAASSSSVTSQPSSPHSAPLSSATAAAVAASRGAAFTNGFALQHAGANVFVPQMSMNGAATNGVVPYSNGNGNGVAHSSGSSSNGVVPCVNGANGAGPPSTPWAKPQPVVASPQKFISTPPNGRQRNSPTAPSILKFGKKNEPYYELSNLAEGYPVKLGGRTWPSAEHYYQAQKFGGNELLIYRLLGLPRPQDAGEFAKKHIPEIRNDWEFVKPNAMYAAVKAKFEQHAPLRALLLETVGSTLVMQAEEGNFLGRKDEYGENMLGRILMIVREDLRRAEQTQSPWEMHAASNGVHHPAANGVHHHYTNGVALQAQPHIANGYANGSALQGQPHIANGFGAHVNGFAHAGQYQHMNGMHGNGH